MVPQIGKAGGLSLKHKGKFVEIITDQHIQPGIHIRSDPSLCIPRAAVAHCGLVVNVLSGHILGMFLCSP